MGGKNREGEEQWLHEVKGGDGEFNVYLLGWVGLGWTGSGEEEIRYYFQEREGFGIIRFLSYHPQSQINNITPLPQTSTFCPNPSHS